MINKVFAACGAAVLAVTSPLAAAADWTGFYAGGAIGWHWDKTDWTTTGLLGGGFPMNASPDSTFSGNGFQVGIYGGHNWQLSPVWVGGIEAAVNFPTGNKTTKIGTPGFLPAPGLLPNDSITVDGGSWEASLRGRFGYLVTPTVMPYMAAGFVYRDPTESYACPGGWPTSGSWCIAPRTQEESLNKVGFTIGAGVEAMAWGNWLVRLDYQYKYFGNNNAGFFQGTADRFTTKSSLNSQSLTVGAAYRF